MKTSFDSQKSAIITHIHADFGTTFSGSSFGRRDKKGGIKEIKHWYVIIARRDGMF